MRRWRLRASWLVCVLMVVGVATGLRAQQEAQSTQSEGGPLPQGHGGPPSPAMELSRLDKALTLTEAQKTSILAILTKQHSEMEALRGSGGAESTATHEQIHGLMETTHKEVRAQLTEAQQVKYDAMRPPRPPSRGGSGQSDGNGPPAPPEGAAPPQ